MKLHKLSMALAIAGVAAISTAAFAEDTHNTGFFAGVGAGYNNMNLPSSTTVNSIAVTTSSKKYMFDIHGGYLFDMGSGFDIGPMLNLDYYGPYTVTATNASASEKFHIYNFNLQAVGQYTWQSFFARVNAGEGYFMIRGNATGGGVTENENEWKPVAGLSVGYYFTPAINVGLFYQHVFGSTVSGGELLPHMNSVGLDVEYAFGGMNSTAS
jgi:hypothetical protein